MNEQQKELEAGENKQLSFESAFARLEEILERLNSGTITLDESLKLYEEADHLIITCSKRLTDAERKIERLIKSRSGELIIGTDQKPLTQEFFHQPTPQSKPGSP